jgi:hypothetical protein
MTRGNPLPFLEAPPDALNGNEIKGRAGKKVLAGQQT